jgi:hypothetical protein
MYEFAPPQAVAWKPFGVPPEYGPENVPVVGLLVGVVIAEPGFVDPPIPLPGRCAASVILAMYL